MVRVIAFDFSGVLFSNGLSIAIQNIKQKFPIEENNIQEALNGDLALGYRTGKESLGEYIQNINKFLNSSLTQSDIINLFFDAYRVIPETVDIIKKLKTKGYKIAYISDNPKDRSEYLENKYHIMQYFDFGLFSWKEGIRKPDIELYRRFIVLAGVLPQEILYIEDKPDNIAPANALGMQSYLFTTPEEFIQGKLQGLLKN